MASTAGPSIGRSAPVEGVSKAVARSGETVRQEVGRLPTVRSSVLLRGKLPLSCQRKRCDDLVGHTPTRSK